MLCFSYLPYPLQLFYAHSILKTVSIFGCVLFVFKDLSSVAGLEFTPIG